MKKQHVLTLLLTCIAMIFSSCATSKKPRFTVYEGMPEKDVIRLNGNPSNLLTHNGAKVGNVMTKAYVYRTSSKELARKHFFIITQKGKVVSWNYQRAGWHMPTLSGH